MPLTLAFVEAVVVFCAAWARFAAAESAGTSFDATLAQALTLTLCGLFAFHFNDLYDLRRVKSFGQFATRLPQTLVLLLLLLGAAHLMLPVLRSPWRTLAEALAFALLLLLPLRAVLHHLFAVHPFSRRVLVLGTTDLAGRLVREMLALPDLLDVVVGVADDGSGVFKPPLPSLRLGPLDKLGKIVAGFRPDLIVCALPERFDEGLVRELLRAGARGIPVEDGLVTYERLTGKIAIEYAAPRAVLFSTDFAPSWITLGCARVLSVLAAIFSVLLLSPLLLPVALLIKLDSEGPIFFLHQRVGLGGRPFNLIKFRTMRPGGALSEWAADNGHRTTRVGHWLRRFRIDELPQFLNILQGDMNLVGPRPHPVSNVELFMENIPYYGIRCSVRPGVTGWAQIRYGYANNLEEETEKMRYDLHYIKHMSLGFDLRILFETVKVVLKGGRSASLSEEPGTAVAPIYFGMDHPTNPARSAPIAEMKLPQAAAIPAPAPAASAQATLETVAVPSLEERRDQPRPSPGVA